MTTQWYDVTPSPKVKQTKSDQWRNPPRPAVAKYRAFRDRVQALGITIVDGDSITFVLPMPQSWPAKKRAAMDGQPHRQKPDLDNLLGGLFDAAMPLEDCHIAELGALRKVWGQVGSIGVLTNRPRNT